MCKQKNLLVQDEILHFFRRFSRKLKAFEIWEKFFARASFFLPTSAFNTGRQRQREKMRNGGGETKTKFSNAADSKKNKKKMSTKIRKVSLKNPGLKMRKIFKESFSNLYLDDDLGFF